MILDRLDNHRLYAQSGTRLTRAFEYLVNEFDSAIPDGRVDVLGDDVFALIQTYDTKPLGKCRFEAHRRYIDIQYVVEGGETVGWALFSALTIEQPYDDEKDVMFFEQPVRFVPLEVHAGLFALFFPHDAHEPGIRLHGYSSVRKVVMKIRV